MNRTAIRAGLIPAAFLFLVCATGSAMTPEHPVNVAGDASALSAQNIVTNESIPAETALQAATARLHTGAILCLASVPTTEDYFSGGADGFLSLHTSDGTTESWQVSDIPVRKIAVHPDGNMVAVYESDGFSIHRLSVWNWKSRTRLFAKRFHDSILSVSWSAKGSFLMIGNTSVDGITILDGETGESRNIFKTMPGIVSFSITGNSEGSMITYGPSGRIIYTDIATGAERASYQGESDLASPAMFANNLRIAGIVGDKILSIDATSGKTTASWTTGKAVLATNSADARPVWFESTGERTWRIRSGDTTSPAFILAGSAEITSALSMQNKIAVGTDTGAVYTIPTPVNMAVAPVMTPQTISPIRAIDDIATDGTKLFILSAGAVYQATGPDQNPVFCFDGIAADHLTLAADSIILWSKKQASPIQRISFDGATRTTIYQPREGIQSLYVSGQTVSFVEGTSQILTYDLSGTDKPFTYTGIGLQDAIPISTDKLLVSKTTSMRSPYPLILINTATGETVPVPVEGELCFGLKIAGTAGPTVAGFLVKSGDTAETDLFTITINALAVSSSVVSIGAIYQDEDTVARLDANDERIVTNLGKAALTDIRADNARQNRFERGYALPAKPVIMNGAIVSLNYDGSLTWFDDNSRRHIADSAMDGRGNWVK